MVIPRQSIMSRFTTASIEKHEKHWGSGFTKGNNTNRNLRRANSKYGGTLRSWLEHPALMFTQ